MHQQNEALESSSRLTFKNFAMGVTFDGQEQCDGFYTEDEVASRRCRMSLPYNKVFLLSSLVLSFACWHLSSM